MVVALGHQRPVERAKRVLSLELRWYASGRYKVLLETSGPGQGDFRVVCMAEGEAAEFDPAASLNRLQEGIEDAMEHLLANGVLP